MRWLTPVESVPGLQEFENLVFGSSATVDMPPSNDPKHYQVSSLVHMITYNIISADDSQLNNIRTNILIQELMMILQLLLTSYLIIYVVFGAPSKSDHHDTSWISKETWHLIDQRRILVHKHRYHHHHLDDEPASKRTRSHDNVESQFCEFSAESCREDCKTKCKDFSHQTRRSLRQDRKMCAAKVGAEAQSFLNNSQVHEAYRTIQGWYKKRAWLPSKLEPNDLRALSDKYADLYSKHPVSGRSIPVNVSLYNISDEIPDEQEIVKALHHLQRGHAPSPTGMTVETLLKWKNDKSIYYR
jgi:hypothetical protein